MRTVTYKINKHSQWIKFEGNNIFRFNCDCPDYIYRKIKTQTPCKHINQIIKMSFLHWTDPKTNMIKGLVNLSESQKKTLRDMVLHFCEGCKLHEDEIGKLQPHRITRGNRGGKYIPSNLKMLCSDCHKRIHEGEFL